MQCLIRQYAIPTGKTNYPRDVVQKRLYIKNSSGQFSSRISTFLTFVNSPTLELEFRIR